MLKNIPAIYKNGVLHPVTPLDLPEGKTFEITVRSIPEKDAEEMEKQISVCSDKEILELAEIKMPSEQDARLSYLLNKQNEENLTADEQKEMWQLMETSRLTTLKKAYALREISRRGLNGKN